MTNLEILRENVRTCKRCPLQQEAERPTPFSGTGSSGILFLFRNPGIQERDEGLPAVGKVKEEVNDLLRRMDLSREDTAITNLVNCYTCIPKPNRPLKLDEIDVCARAHLLPLLGLVNPKLIVTFGKEPFLFFMKDKGFTTIRGFSGTMMECQPAQGSIPLFPMEHPAVHSLYDPRMKGVWERDVRELTRYVKLLKQNKPFVNPLPTFG